MSWVKRHVGVSMIGRVESRCHDSEEDTMYGNQMGDASRQARDIANAGLQATDDSVRVLMDKLQIPRELAVYLLSLEARIMQLEQQRSR
jgi:hypothetical protein